MSGPVPSSQAKEIFMSTNKRHLPLRARNKKIVELWDMGLSSGEIMKKMNLSSRGVVTGLVQRARLKGAKLREAIEDMDRPKPRRKPYQLGGWGKTPIPMHLLKIPVPYRKPLPNCADEHLDVVRVPFVETTARQCLWPLWNPGDEIKECCGRKTAFKKSYCTEHDARQWRGGTR